MSVCLCFCFLSLGTQTTRNMRKRADSEYICLQFSSIHYEFNLRVKTSVEIKIWEESETILRVLRV